MKYLIVNADDLGMTKGINEGIVKAVREGIVTGVSMLAPGDAFDDAVAAARSLGIRDVGAHLALTEVGMLSSPERIGGHNALALRLASGRMDPERVRAEFTLQIERIRSAGFEISRLDSHEHVHMLPAIQRVLLELAAEFKIPAIRSLREERLGGRVTCRRAYRLLVNRALTAACSQDLARSGVFHPDRLLGFLDAGRLSEKLLVDMIETVEEGVTELVAHPGFLSEDLLEKYAWHVNCEDELFALTGRAVKRAIEKGGICLTTYQEAIRRAGGV